jgi:hypothetical protein
MVFRRGIADERSEIELAFRRSCPVASSAVLGDELRHGHMRLRKARTA